MLGASSAGAVGAEGAVVEEEGEAVRGVRVVAGELVRASSFTGAWTFGWDATCRIRDECRFSPVYADRLGGANGDLDFPS
jgi:hypothetical protein